ncbi:MFS transporter [Microbacterium capsulatum]|uniref:MFS transporter n=1 Tax=Microbacterium capsulatum TaxID=3041921 RepID=A0ABU0XIB3_9MICO|nr:MFS transporter [Microbacterium sp. ASV81]MDQ4214308.1 MFS transporter [Microbacterium sp. ASV81]
MDGQQHSQSTRDQGQRAPLPTGTAAIPVVLDRIGFNRAQKVILALVLAGMFFSALEENAMGAIAGGLHASFDTTTQQLGFMATFETFGFIIGRLLAGYLGDKFGRRWVLSLNLLLYTIGGLLTALSPNIELFVLFRIVVGIGLGGEFTIGLAMISEMVATRHRGTVSASLNIGSGGIGNFVAYALFLLVLGGMNDMLGGTVHSWRWLLVFLAVPSLMVVFFRRYLPESPRYLLSKGDVLGANRVLTILESGSLRTKVSDDEVKTFVTEADIPAPASKDKSPLKVLFTTGKSIRKLAALGLASWLSFGANGTLFVLLPVMLMDKGYSITDSLLFTMITNLGGLTGASLAAFLAGKVARKRVLILAAFAGCIVGISFALFAQDPVTIMLFGALFKICSMLLNTTLAAWWPEQFPTAIRARGTSFLNAISTSSSMLLPPIAAAVAVAVGINGVFVMFAVMYGIITLAVLVPPETRGRDLEEIEV